MTERDPEQEDREQHITSLVAMLSTTGIETRWKAAHDLACLGDPVAIPRLAQTMIDGEHDASRAAAYVLTQVGPPGVA
jgi:HEAT repeat protein